MEIQELIEEAKSLPVEERARLADSLLRSLNQTDSDVDHAWAKEAQKRLKQIRNGTVELTPGKQVFEEIHEKYSE